MIENRRYEERLTSTRTEALFLTLALLFFFLWRRRVRAGGWHRAAKLLFSLCALFLFYALNYRALHIVLTAETLTLRFGLFRWRIAMDNVAGCYLDDISLWRIGGAGIHFSWFNRRYRAMFNFLEYPRVVVALKDKQGPVHDVAFSTRQPQQVMAFIHGSVDKTRAARANKESS